MKEHSITVDVYCHWSEKPPVYRVYVDNDLLTEREFIWPGSEIFLRENILVNLEPGTHCVKIEKISTHGTITAKNVQVNGVASTPEFITTE